VITAATTSKVIPFPGRGQDLGAFETECPHIGGRSGGEPDCPQRGADRGRIGQHVPGVSKQHQRAGQHRNDDLDEHEPTISPSAMAR
jgi:hypothetical protein